MMELDEEDLAAPVELAAGGSASYSSSGGSAEGYVSGGNSTAVQGNVTEQFLPAPWGPDKDKVVRHKCYVG
jgi:hypothetical protein